MIHIRNYKDNSVKHYKDNSVKHFLITHFVFTSLTIYLCFQFQVITISMEMVQKIRTKLNFAKKKAVTVYFLIILLYLKSMYIHLINNNKME